MPETTCTFAFTPGQIVKTPWGDMGIITMAALNEDGGQDYFVKRNKASKWLQGSQLEALEDIPEPPPMPRPEPGPMPGPMPGPIPWNEKPPAAGYQPKSEDGTGAEPPSEE